MANPTQSTSTPSPKDSTEHSTVFTMSPPGAPDRNMPVYPVWNHPKAFGHIPNPPILAKVDQPSSADDKRSFDENDPSTWPTLYLPYHMTPGCSSPTHIGEVLVHVHYKGAGASLLRELLFKAIDAVDTEEEKQGIERMAFLCWPFNVTSNGYWKNASGLTEKEVEQWRNSIVET